MFPTLSFSLPKTGTVDPPLYTRNEDAQVPQRVLLLVESNGPFPSWHYLIPLWHLTLLLFSFWNSLFHCFFFFFKNFLFFFKFIYLWLCWVFVSVRGLSLVVASGGHSSSRCAGLSLSQPLLLQGTGSRCSGSVTVAHGPTCSAACGIFPDQGSNPCSLHWQADSQPLRHQGSPSIAFWDTACYWFSSSFSISSAGCICLAQPLITCEPQLGHWPWPLLFFLHLFSLSNLTHSCGPTTICKQMTPKYVSLA